MTSGRSRRGGLELLGALVVLGILGAGVGVLTAMSGGTTRILQDQVNAIEGFYAGEVAVTHLYLRETNDLAPLGSADPDGGFPIPLTARGYFASPRFRGQGRPPLPTKAAPPAQARARGGRGPASVEETEEVASDSGNLVRRLEEGRFRVLPGGSLPDPRTRCGEISYRGRGTTHRVCLRTLAGRRIIAANSTHACGVVDGAAFCWGANFWGELGNNSGAILSTVPVAVFGLDEGVEAVATGLFHSCAVVRGTVQCWGSNLLGQIGRAGAALQNRRPLEVTGMDAGVTALATGNSHTCAVRDGGAWCWGSNTLGQLGRPLGSPLTSNVPMPVPGLDSGVTDIAAGGDHTCAIVNGGVLCWGSNILGELGFGAITGWRATPTPVTGLDTGINTLGLGWFHSCASGEEGTWCWGEGVLGALGGGLVPFALNPIPVAGNPRFTSISGGIGHTCASDGTAVSCWGLNALWAFGSMLPPLAFTPVAAPGLSGGVPIEAVAAGGLFSCAHDGSRIRCGGWNVLGQLGLGHQFPISLPGWLGLGLL